MRYEMKADAEKRHWALACMFGSLLSGKVTTLWRGWCYLGTFWKEVKEYEIMNVEQNQEQGEAVKSIISIILCS